MRNETIFVTGGSGFIGSHLVEKLLARGNRVLVFDTVPLGRSQNLEAVRHHPSLTYVEGDIRNEEALSRVIHAGVDKIYHLSAVVGVKNYCDDPLKVIDVNFMGTRHVLGLALKHKIKVIFTSTSEVYGKNPNVPWSEDSDRVLGATHIDRWSYSSSKALGEQLAFAMHKSFGLPVTVVRYFNVYGPRQSPQYIVSQSIHRILRNEPPLLYDQGSQTRCFTFVDDAIEGTMAAADHPDANGQIFNIGNHRESSIRDVIALILQWSPTKLTYQDLDTKQHYGQQYEDIGRRIPNVDKAKRILSWSAKTPLEEGVRKTIEWAKNHPLWLDQVPSP